MRRTAIVLVCLKLIEDDFLGGDSTPRQTVAPIVGPTSVRTPSNSAIWPTTSISSRSRTTLSCRPVEAHHHLPHGVRPPADVHSRSARADLPCRGELIPGNGTGDEERELVLEQQGFVPARRPLPRPSTRPLTRGSGVAQLPNCRTLMRRSHWLIVAGAEWQANPPRLQAAVLSNCSTGNQR